MIVRLNSTAFASLSSSQEELDARQFVLRQFTNQLVHEIRLCNYLNNVESVDELRAARVATIAALTNLLLAYGADRSSIDEIVNSETD